MTKITAFTYVAVGAAATELVGPNARRVRLEIWPANALGTVTVAPSQGGAATGLRVTSAGPPLVITKEDHGASVVQPWWGVGGGAGQDAFVIETSEE